MHRKPLYLVAAIAETARFFVLAFLANALGGLDGGSSLPAFFRYAAGAQLLFVLGFFFLWLDRPRYDAYRSLLFVGTIVSLAVFLPLMLSMLRTAGGLLPPSSRLLPSLAAFAVDAFAFFLLLATKPFSLDSAPLPPPGPSGPANPGPGPADIEEVENI